jgi:hypothetical protein
MITPSQKQERKQIAIFMLICLAMIIAGFAWAVWGDASQVTPVPTATAVVMEATPATPAP